MFDLQRQLKRIYISLKELYCLETNVETELPHTHHYSLLCVKSNPATKGANIAIPQVFVGIMKPTLFSPAPMPSQISLSLPQCGRRNLRGLGTEVMEVVEERICLRSSSNAGRYRAVFFSCGKRLFKLSWLTHMDASPVLLDRNNII